MTKTNQLTERKTLLLLKGEALRLQLAMDVFESKQSLKPQQLFKNALGSAQILTLIGSFLTRRRKGTRLSLIFTLGSILLWAKKRLK